MRPVVFIGSKQRPVAAGRERELDRVVGLERGVVERQVDGVGELGPVVGDVVVLAAEVVGDVGGAGAEAGRRFAVGDLYVGRARVGHQCLGLDGGVVAGDDGACARSAVVDLELECDRFVVGHGARVDATVVVVA